MLELARALMRALDPKVGSRVALAIANDGLESALRGLIKSAGAEVVTDSGAHGCVVQIDGVARYIPEPSRDAIELVSTGGAVVAIALGGTRGLVDGVAEYWMPRLRCQALEALSLKSMTMLHGTRAEPMTNKDRKRLRAVGHSLDASVLVGRAGLSEELIDAAEQALLRHGIVKVKLTSGSDLDKGKALADLAWATGSALIQRIGKSAVLHRADVPLEPPGKRSGRR
jgi:RNA-binding protein